MLTPRGDIKLKMASLRFYDLKADCPSNAGIMLFGTKPEYYYFGGYVQHVRFYPHIAIRELIMNAVMHRDYESNALSKFYEFSDRLEIVNPGGLYGNARPENFPTVSDDRNPIVAKAMKVLGYVNKYDRGIYNVQTELVENGNGEAIFDFDKITVFGATGNNNLELLLAKLSIDRKDFFVNYDENENKQININITDNVTDSHNIDPNVTDRVTDKLKKNQQEIVQQIIQNNTITSSELSQIVSI